MALNPPPSVVNRESSPTEHLKVIGELELPRSPMPVHGPDVRTPVAFPRTRYRVDSTGVVPPREPDDTTYTSAWPALVTNDLSASSWMPVRSATARLTGAQK